MSDEKILSGKTQQAFAVAYCRQAGSSSSSSAVAARPRRPSVHKMASDRTSMKPATHGEQFELHGWVQSQCCELSAAPINPLQCLCFLGDKAKKGRKKKNPQQKILTRNCQNRSSTILRCSSCVIVNVSYFTLVVVQYSKLLLHVVFVPGRRLWINSTSFKFLSRLAKKWTICHCCPVKRHTLVGCQMSSLAYNHFIFSPTRVLSARISEWEQSRVRPSLECPNTYSSPFFFALFVLKAGNVVGFESTGRF